MLKRPDKKPPPKQTCARHHAGSLDCPEGCPDRLQMPAMPAPEPELPESPEPELPESV